MGPDDFDVGITGEDGIPDLEMLDLPEVPLWLVFVIEESRVMDSEEILPPRILGTSLPVGYHEFFVEEGT